MCNLCETRERCQVVLINGLTGTQFQVERLPRQPGTFTRGFRLTGPDDVPAFAHELPSGLQECSCPTWTEDRRCEHTALLAGAGLFAEPVPPEDLCPAGYFPEDDLAEIDWEAGAP